MQFKVFLFVQGLQQVAMMKRVPILIAAMIHLFLRHSVCMINDHFLLSVKFGIQCEVGNQSEIRRSMGMWLRYLCAAH